MMIHEPAGLLRRPVLTVLQDFHEKVHAMPIQKVHQVISDHTLWIKDKAPAPIG